MPTRVNSSRALTIVSADSSHRIELTEAGLKLVEELAAKGVAHATIASALQVAHSTFKELRKREPELEEALARGEARFHDSLVEVLTDEVKRRGPRAVVAAMFLLKCRAKVPGTDQPYCDSPKPVASAEINVRPGGVLVVPALAASAEEWEAEYRHATIEVSADTSGTPTTVGNAASGVARSDSAKPVVAVDERRSSVWR